VIWHDNDRNIQIKTYIYTHDKEKLKNKIDIEFYDVYDSYCTKLYVKQLNTIDEWNKLNTYLEYYIKMANWIHIENIENINIKQFLDCKTNQSLLSNEKKKIMISNSQKINITENKEMINYLDKIFATRFYYNDEILTIENINNFITNNKIK
jgi:hypothetical protein